MLAQYCTVYFKIVFENAENHSFLLLDLTPCPAFPAGALYSFCGTVGVFPPISLLAPHYDRHPRDLSTTLPVPVHRPRQPMPSSATLPAARSRGRGPLSPDWDRGRPYLTHGALRAAAAAAAFESAPTPSPPLASYTSVVQDAVAADDVLSALLGVPGVFVRPRLAGKAGGGEEVVFEFVEGRKAGGGRAEAAVGAIAGKVLGLADDYVRVAAFVEKGRVAGEAGGYVKQALAVALGELLEDYRSFVVRLEGSLRKGELSLQRLLFYVQPSMRSMALLRRIVECVEGRSGGAVLEAVYGLAAKHVGSGDAREVLAFVVGRTAAPVLDCMRLWMAMGIIDDKYHEFFVEENTRYARVHMRDDPTGAKSWDMQYRINRDNVPTFLAPFVEKILRAGKYLNVLRESALIRRTEGKTGDDEGWANAGVGIWGGEGGGVGDPVEIPGDVLLGPDAARRIAAIVDKAYLYSSERLIKELRETVNVVARLRSIKRYFLLEQGDFLVHFFDAAAEELAKAREDVSESKLSSLLELSVRTSVSASDPYHDDLGCKLCATDLASQILGALGGDASTGKSIAAQAVEDSSGAEQSTAALSGYDTFSLDYSVSWPMNLIVSGMEILKYQLLFRYLFHCKHVERELEGCWRSLAQVKGSHMSLRAAFARTFALRHRMLQFLRGMLYYIVADVLEPNWVKFEDACSNSETIDEIMSHHSAFLDSCLSQCLLSNERHLRVFHNVTKVCLLFATYTAGFTSHLSTTTPPSEMEEMMRERDYAGTLAKIERTFDGTFREVLDGLSTMSKRRASTHLANLCESLDFDGFYERAAMEAAANLHA